MAENNEKVWVSLQRTNKKFTDYRNFKKIKWIVVGKGSGRGSGSEENEIKNPWTRFPVSTEKWWTTSKRTQTKKYRKGEWIVKKEDCLFGKWLHWIEE